MLIVAPKDDPIVNLFSPHHLDSKQVTEGSTAYLPVYVEGALFGVGDLHSVQGDGELSAVAVETEGEIQIRFVVNHSKKIKTPHIETDDYYMTTGRGASSDDAARTALREMISWLMGDKGLSREEAYMLCSVTADMRINQVAGYPIQFCSARIEMPKSIFK